MEDSVLLLKQGRSELVTLAVEAPALKRWTAALL
jgi:hypothetical protein